MLVTGKFQGVFEEILSHLILDIAAKSKIVGGMALFLELTLLTQIYLILLFFLSCVCGIVEKKRDYLPGILILYLKVASGWKKWRIKFLSQRLKLNVIYINLF